MKKRTKIGLIMGLAYLIDRISYPDKYKKKEPELNIELKYTPSDVTFEKIKFENPKDVLCPYCSYRFPEMPKRKRNCPSCEKLILRKKNYETKMYELITVEQYDKECDENDKEYIISTQKEMRDTLLRYKEAGCRGVKISTGNPCPECLRQKGKFYTIDDALREMPIPFKHCSAGQCQCCYIPEI